MSSLLAYPYPMLRIAGLPANIRLGDADAADHRREEHRLHRDLAVRKSAVCDRLGAMLSSLYERDSRIGRAALTIKRDLYNLRTPSPQLVQRLLTALDVDTREQVAAVLALITRRDDVRRAFRVAYERGFRDAGDDVLRWFADSRLRRAIEVTNQAFSDQATALERGKQGLSAKDRHLILLSLGRYVLRASRKVSPLSSLGTIALGTWSDELLTAGDVVPRCRLPEQIGSATSLRIGALDYVFQLMLARYEEIASSTLVEPTGSLRQRGGGYAWLRVEDDGMAEARVRGARVSRIRSDAPVVSLIRSCFDAGVAAMPLQALQQRLIGKLESGTSARADALLRTAWRHRLIQPVLPVTADIACWSRQAAACLVPDRRAPVEAALTALLTAAEDGAVANVDGAFDALIAAAAIDIPVARFRPLLFEDCTTEPWSFSLPLSLVSRFERDFEALLRIAAVLTAGSARARLKAKITAMFLEIHGGDGACEDVHEFVVTCAERLRGTSDLHEPLPASGDAPVPGSGDTVETGARLARAAREDLLRYLARCCDGDEPVTLDHVAIAHVAARGHSHARPGATSQMLFLQRAFVDGEERLVVNQVYPGAGCMLSRFLPDDAGRLAAVRDYLERVADKSECAEFATLFGFNANQHPTILNDVLSAPAFGGAPSPSIPETLSLADLTLRYCERRGALRFHRRDGSPVTFFSLGLLSPALMPDMHRIMHALTFDTDTVESLWSLLAPRLAPRSDGSIALPRMQIGGLVVVRRMVAVRADDLPDARLKPVDFFAAFIDWADHRALPRRLFFQRHSFANLRRFPTEALDAAAPARRATKPMPLDRDNPLEVALLQRSLAASALDVAFFEALPDGTDGQVLRGAEAFTAELGIELTLMHDDDAALRSAA